MADSKTVQELTAAEIREHLAQRAGDVEDFTTSCWPCAGGDERIHAFADLDARVIRLQAAHLKAERAQGRAAGALYGVPVAVKDIIDTIDFPTDLRQPHPRGPLCRGRRDGGAPPARRRRGDLRQDRDDRVRDLPSRPDAQPAQPGAHAGRLVQRFGGGGGRRRGAGGPGHADQWLGAPTRIVLRGLRLQALAGVLPRTGSSSSRRRWTRPACSRARWRIWPGGRDHVRRRRPGPGQPGPGRRGSCCRCARPSRRCSPSSASCARPGGARSRPRRARPTRPSWN
jgi:hypothetical protein